AISLGGPRFVAAPLFLSVTPSVSKGLFRQSGHFEDCSLQTGLERAIAVDGNCDDERPTGRGLGTGNAEEQTGSVDHNYPVESLRLRGRVGERNRVGGSSNIGQVVPRRVSDLLLPLNAIDPAPDGAPRKTDVAIGEGHGGQAGGIGDEDRAEQLGEALAADGHALFGGGLGG